MNPKESEKLRPKTHRWNPRISYPTSRPHSLTAKQKHWCYGCWLNEEERHRRGSAKGRGGACLRDHRVPRDGGYSTQRRGEKATESCLPINGEIRTEMWRRDSLVRPGPSAVRQGTRGDRLGIGASAVAFNLDPTGARVSRVGTEAWALPNQPHTRECSPAGITSPPLVVTCCHQVVTWQPSDP